MWSHCRPDGGKRFQKSLVERISRHWKKRHEREAISRGQPPLHTSRAPRAALPPAQRPTSQQQPQAIMERLMVFHVLQVRKRGNVHHILEIFPSENVTGKEFMALSGNQLSGSHPHQVPEGTPVSPDVAMLVGHLHLWSVYWILSILGGNKEETFQGEKAHASLPGEPWSPRPAASFVLRATLLSHSPRLLAPAAASPGTPPQRRRPHLHPSRRSVVIINISLFRSLGLS